MVGELTWIFMDTSKWMCHNRYLEQVDAIELYCKKKLRSHPDNHVGIFATGQTGFGSVVEPTRDLSKIMNGVCGFTLVGGYTDLETAMDLAPFRCFNLTFKDKNKGPLKRMRILVFAGGYVGEDVGGAFDIGAKLNWWGIALDVVNFGTYDKVKCRILKALVDEANNWRNGDYTCHQAINNSNSCRLLHLSSHLYRSSILCLVGEGGNFDRKRRRDDSDDSRDMHGDGKKRAEVGMKKAV